MQTLRLLPLLLLTGLQPPVAAQETAAPIQGGWEAAATKLCAATATVRIRTALPAEGGAAAGEDKSPPYSVTVCTGVCVAEGRVVTAAFAGTDAQIRLTLAGGTQADAALLAIDEYSGLALLKCAAAPLAPLDLGGDLPAVGQELLAGAAWGTEPPLVARGLVAGVERKHPSGSYPPLVQCELLTVETSCGGPLVDRRGSLVGLIVASDAPPGGRGWAFAVPVSQVERLLRAAEQRQGDGVVVLKRRRPVVGMVLDQRGEAVVVERMTAGGPAERAGIRVGDRVLATDGVSVRSVYQAVLPTLYKQPGDTTTFRVQRGDSLLEIKVVLGGGVELTSAPRDALAGLMQPKVELARDGQGAIVARRPAGNVREVFAPPLPDDPPPAAAPTPADKIALLEKALGRYQAVIELQQRQLGEEQKRRSEQEAVIKALRAEIDAIRAALAPAGPPAPAPASSGKSPE
jgi:putative serine protease PepD